MQGTKSPKTRLRTILQLHWVPIVFVGVFSESSALALSVLSSSLASKYSDSVFKASQGDPKLPFSIPHETVKE